MPMILFVYLFATSLFYNAKETFKDSILKIFKQILPLFLALFVFVIYFLSIRSSINVQASFQDTLERVLWLSPQIFVHFSKLIFFPFHLTIDQSALVKLGGSLFSGYSMFCFLSMFTLILFSLLSLFFIKRKLAFYFFLPFAIFFFALAPFLHIFSPTYNLASERYLYFPLLMLVVGASHVIFYLLSTLHSKKEDRSMIPILVIILPLVVITSGRAFIRTYDWKDSRSLFTSSLKEAPNGLLEGLRLSTLGNLYIAMKDDSSKIKGNQYIQEAIDILESSLTELEKAKNEHQGKLPKVVKKYGLDPKTIQAKVAYLLALTKYDLRVDANGALESLKPYMEDLSIADTQILDLYLGLLFATNNLDEAENILNKVSKEKYSPVVLTILSELHRVKYNNYAQAENYLTKSFKQFPYDVQTLSALRNLYVKTNQAEKFAYFSYLHGIRTHSIKSLEEAYTIFTKLNNIEMADKVLKNAKLLVG
ncbi:MAG: hypothetical protein HYZ79_01785 [Candidatus Melainabacteria bacterium]|nr:hypothetical protein [Candidatus Melainabacteria bacterium]